MPSKADQLGPAELYRSLVNNGVGYFCGVPDSILSSFSSYLEDHAKHKHDIAINEGNAVALAIGYYLATEKIPLVYMQNSGLGNATNPLVSLADPLIMGVPLILLIGWRGQPGKIDEPQHKKQGLVTTKVLTDLDIPYTVLSCKSGEVLNQVTKAIKMAKQSQKPVALLVEAGTLPTSQNQTKKTNYPISREYVVKAIANSLENSDAIVATTGKTSRELFEHRETTGRQHAQDLLVVGGMGHASTIALSIALQKPGRKIYCMDGDGAALMHFGALASIGSQRPANFYHFVINNGTHESVGGQPTVALDINIPAVAKACGYRHTYLVADGKKLDKVLHDIRELSGPILVEVRVNNKSRSNLKRPAIHPKKNKQAFISFLKDDREGQ